MTNITGTDRPLKLAEDGQPHTAECVDMGWWLLDWEADCVHVGVPQGGHVAALAERALFITTLTLLPLATVVADAVMEVRRGR